MNRSEHARGDMSSDGVPEDERALRQAIEIITPDDFEELVHALVQVEWSNARKLAPPDGGADSLLPGDAPGTYLRVWQAKRFTGSVSWPQCVKSLDAAVSSWSAPHVTFVFAKNLTGAQQKSFDSKLATRHPATTIDWWGATELLRRIRGCEGGLRAARRFLNLHPTRDFERAIRAKGALTRGADLFDRSLATSEFADGADPDYEYRITTGPSGRESSPPATGVVMRLERTLNGQRATVDAFPRNEDVLARRPIVGAVLFDESPTGLDEGARFAAMLESGGSLEGSRAITLDLKNLPAVFADLMGTEGIRPSRVELSRPKWLAKWVVAAGGRIHGVDMDFVATSLSPYFAMEGRTGGLRVTLAFIPDPENDKGQLRADWVYTPSTEPLALEAQVLDLVRAMLSGGTAQLEGRDGRVEPVAIQLPSQEPDPYLEELAEYFGALKMIEGRIGRPLPRPQTVEQGDLVQIAAAAAVLTDGGRTLEVHSAAFAVVMKSGLDEFMRGLATGEIALPYSPDQEFTIFGESVNLGPYAVPLPPGTLKWERSKQDDPEQVQLTFAAGPGDNTVWGQLTEAAEFAL